jgi:glycosyltransferase involved in cell wall biosynthesis
MGFPPLLVFADDWGRHPSSAQHLVRNLLPTRNVCWINTIGMRVPAIKMSTVVRGAQKIRKWLSPRRSATQRLPAHLQVKDPWMWPWFTSQLDRRVNRSLLVRQLVPVIRSLATPPVVVTTLPITSDLVGRLPATRWVYYCVDDYSKWPGLDQRTLAEMEAELVRGVDVVLAVSETLQERIAQMGRKSQLLTHGVDLDHWQNAVAPPQPQGYEALERPWIVFWGLIDQRVDVELVRQTAQRLQRGTVLLVGPEQDADPALARLPRVARVPPLDYSQLPHLAREAAVLIMPYADLPVTRAIQPLKLKEYMATGKPTVVRDLPVVRAWSDCLDVAETADQFAETVRRRLADGLPSRQREARRRLSNESWTAKAREFEQVIDGSAHDSFPVVGAAIGSASSSTFEAL